MAMNFFESPLCNSRNHCDKCRLSRDWRKGVREHFDDIDSNDFACPYGVTKDDVAPLPSAMEQGKTFAKSMVKEASHKAKGGKSVSEEEYNRRLSICHSCPLYDNGRCRKCGCFMKLKAKLATASCPKKKW